MKDATAKHIEEVRAGVDLLKEVSGDAREIIVAMLKAAASNPVFGIIGSIIVVDFLVSRKVISPIGAAFAYTAIGALDAQLVANVANELVQGNYDVLWGAISVNRPTAQWADVQPSASAITWMDSKSESSDDSKQALPVALAAFGEAAKAAAVEVPK